MPRYAQVWNKIMTLADNWNVKSYHSLTHYLTHRFQITPLKMPLNHCNLDVVMNELMTSGQVALRQKTIEYFNRVCSYEYMFLFADYPFF